MIYIYIFVYIPLTLLNQGVYSSSGLRGLRGRSGLVCSCLVIRMDWITSFISMKTENITDQAREDKNINLMFTYKETWNLKTLREMAVTSVPPLWSINILYFKKLERIQRSHLNVNYNQKMLEKLFGSKIVLLPFWLN